MRGEDERARAEGDDAGGGRTGHAEAGQGAPAQHERGGEQQVQHAGPRHGPRGQEHAPGATDHAGERVEEPEDGGPAEEHPRVSEGRIQGRAVAAEGAIDRGPCGQQRAGEERAHGERDQEPVGGEAVGFLAPAPAQRARHRRGDAAAHAPRRHGLHEHEQRVDERDAGKGLRPQPAHEHGVHGADAGLQQHHRHPGRGEPQERGRDGSLEQGPRARIGGVRRLAAGGGAAPASVTGAVRAVVVMSLLK